jgi:NADH-quinone oxidoreductase subunit C
MNQSKLNQLSSKLQAVAGVKEAVTDVGELTLVVDAEKLIEAATALRDHYGFEQLMDVCAVDYSQYGVDEWATGGSGFSRGVESNSFGRMSFGDEAPVYESDEPRFAVVYQLLSVQNNSRVRLKVFATDNEFPVVPSVCEIWSSANWPEREAFDLMGVHFDGHPDLRRLLTDYGFVGHPFRKDFPLVGNVEMRYDPQKKRVIYEPVTIEPRVLVPRVIRNTSRRTADPAADAHEEGKAEEGKADA